MEEEQEKKAMWRNFVAAVLDIFNHLIEKISRGVTLVTDESAWVLLRAAFVIFLCWMFLTASIALYFGLRYFYIPTAKQTMPIYFDYSGANAEAKTAGLSIMEQLKDSMFPQLSLQDEKNRVKRSEIQPHALIELGGKSRARTLAVNQQYNIYVEMDVPESDLNDYYGVFMVNLTLLSADGKPRMNAMRPAMLYHRSPLLRIVRTLAFSPLLLSGLIEERQSLIVQMQQNYVDNVAQHSVYASISLSKPVQVYSAKLLVEAHYTGLKAIMVKYRALAGPVAITMLFLLQITFVCGVLLAWYVKSSRQVSAQSIHDATQADCDFDEDDYSNGCDGDESMDTMKELSNDSNIDSENISDSDLANESNGDSDNGPSNGLDNDKANATECKAETDLGSKMEADGESDVVKDEKSINDDGETEEDFEWETVPSLIRECVLDGESPGQAGLESDGNAMLAVKSSSSTITGDTPTASKNTPLPCNDTDKSSKESLPAATVHESCQVSPPTVSNLTSETSSSYEITSTSAISKSHTDNSSLTHVSPALVQQHSSTSSPEAHSTSQQFSSASSGQNTSTSQEYFDSNGSWKKSSTATLVQDNSSSCSSPSLSSESESTTSRLPPNIIAVLRNDQRAAQVNNEIERKVIDVLMSREMKEREEKRYRLRERKREKIAKRKSDKHRQLDQYV